MKKSFLAKIKKEGKLEAVEPSDNIKDSYTQKSESYLMSARILLKNNRLEESISMAYYSMYYILTALLFKVGIKCENHFVSIYMLKEIFGIDNSDIVFAKKERVDKQYYVDFSITKNDVELMIEAAEKFSNKINDFISKINNEDIIRYRRKFAEALK